MKADEVNFEWPTQEILDELPSDAYLEKLEFKSVQGIVLSSVRVCLSNGKSSPVFQNRNIRHRWDNTVSFEKDKPVREVGAQDG